MLAMPLLHARLRRRHAECLYDLPEIMRRPMMEAFEESSGIRVKFFAFFRRSAVARHAEKEQSADRRAVQVVRSKTLDAGQNQGFSSLICPPGAAELPPISRTRAAPGRRSPRSAGVHDQHAVSEQEQPAGADVLDDLLNPAYKNMLQMATRALGTAVTRIFSVLQVHNGTRTRRSYMKKLRQKRAALHQERRRRPRCRSDRQAGGGIIFIVMRCSLASKGYDVQISFPKEASVRRRNALR